MIKFNQKTHKYFDEGGKKVLSVTQVLSCLGDIQFKQSFIEKTLLGSRVHEMAEAINKEWVKKGTVTIPKCECRPEDLNYIGAYAKFMLDENPVIFATERKLYHEGFKYAGTMDLGMVTRGKRWIVDLKTSAELQPTVPLQLSAYMEAWNKEFPKDKITNRAAIHLKPAGVYVFKVYSTTTHKADFDIFLCKLKSKQWDEINRPEIF